MISTIHRWTRNTQEHKEERPESNIREIAEHNVFFVKRFHKPHFKDIVTALRNCGRLNSLNSQAGLERKNAHKLLENGIETYKPVCLGERTVSGFERMSFLITEELTSISMLDLLCRNDPASNAHNEKRFSRPWQSWYDRFTS